jgi:CheY-like chemotaxis protein
MHPSIAPLPLGVPRLKVLVVDDQADSADSLGLLLAQLGHDTQVAYSALEGVRQATTFLPDVVMLDIHMPSIDGLDAARAIRSCRLASHPVLVALTADTRPGARDATLAAGFDFHLTKPLPAGDLAALMRDVLPSP